MGNKCTASKKSAESSRISKKKANIASNRDGDGKTVHSKRKNQFFFKDSSSYADKLSNIENLSTPDSKGKPSLSELMNDQLARPIHLRSPNGMNANISSTLNDLENRKSFQYKKGPLIAKGCYGDVFECLNLNSGELLAVKSIKASKDLNQLQNYTEALKKEVSLLNELSHPNVIRYYAIEVPEARAEKYSIIDIILEYISGGSIRVLVDKFGKLEERIVSNYTKQILEGLAYLHDNGIVHSNGLRNVKSSNILIDACGTAKLTDFGCFKNLDKFVDLSSQEDGLKSPSSPKTSVYWSAPEVIMKKSQGRPSDIWSVGCVVIEMLTGLPPWKNSINSFDDLCKALNSGAVPSFPDNISGNCRSFLHKIFKSKPEDRPSAQELLTHAFIRDPTPSMTCLDLDSMLSFQIFQSTNGVKTTDSAHDDVFNKEEQNQDKQLDLGGSRIQVSGSETASHPEKRKVFKIKNNTGLRLHVDSDKRLSSRDHTNNSLPMIDECFVQSGLNKIPEEQSIDISKNKSFHSDLKPKNNEIENSRDVNAETLNQIKRTMPLDSDSNNILTNNTFTSPIKNTFYNRSNPTNKNELNTEGRPVAVQLKEDHLEKDVDKLDIHEKIHRPLQELSNIQTLAYKGKEDEFGKSVDPNHDNNNKENLELKDLESEEQRKIESRKRYEQEMEQELLKMNLSHTNNT